MVAERGKMACLVEEVTVNNSAGFVEISPIFAIQDDFLLGNRTSWPVWWATKDIICTELGDIMDRGLLFKSASE